MIMKVLVIGGGGRIGRYLLHELDGRHEAAVFDVVAPQDWQGKFYEGDIMDLPRLVQVMQQERFDVAVHLALKRAPSGAGVVREDADLSAKLFEANLVGTFHVLEAARRAGVGKVIFASTSMVLGHYHNQPLTVPVDETHPFGRMEHYGLGKQIGEELCKAYARDHGIRTVCLRLCWVWFPELADNYRPLVDAPSRWRLWAYTHVADAARAFRLAAEAEGLSEHEVFCICADDNGTREESHALIERFWSPPPSGAEALTATQSLVSNAKAKRLLGYQPKFTWRDVVGK